MGYRGFSKFLKGKSAPEHSLLKLYGSEALQQALLFGTEALGIDELDLEWLGPQMWREGSWAIQYLRSFAATIPGRHERDPAQHHRRAGARASPRVTTGCQ